MEVDVQHVAGVPKRIVIEHTAPGKMFGLMQILGHSDQLHGKCATFLEGITIGDHEGNASLIKVLPRFLHYREGFTAEKNTAKTWHPAQQ